MARPLPQIILEEEEDEESVYAPSPSPRPPLAKVDSLHRSHSPSVLSQTSRHFSQPRIDGVTMTKMIQLGTLSEKQSRFGNIYKFLHKTTMQEYAVTKWQTDMTEEQLTHICNELEYLSAVTHPRLATFYAYNLSGSTLTMFRQYVPSGTVGDILKQGPLAESTALTYFRQAMEALQYLHERNMVHGNVKAVNLLLTLADDVKLADKSISDTPTPDLHRRRRLLYAAPELMKTRETLFNISAPADIWAMGCVLVTMVTRFPPFKDHFLRLSTDEVHEKLIKMHSSSPSPYRSETLIPSASRQLSDLVDYLLEPNVEKRPKARQVLERVADSRSYSVASTSASSIPVKKMNHDDLYYSDAPVTPIHPEKQTLLSEAKDDGLADEHPIAAVDCLRWYSSRLLMFFLLLFKWIGMVLLAACSLAMVAGSVFFAIFVIYNGIAVVCQCQLNEGFIVLIALILLPIIILLTTLCCNNTCEKYKVAKEDGTMERSRYVSAHPQDDIVLCGIIVVPGKREQRKLSVKRKNAQNEENDPIAANNLPRTAFARIVANIA